MDSKDAAADSGSVVRINNNSSEGSLLTNTNALMNNNTTVETSQVHKDLHDTTGVSPYQVGLTDQEFRSMESHRRNASKLSNELIEKRPSSNGVLDPHSDLVNGRTHEGAQSVLTKVNDPFSSVSLIGSLPKTTPKK